MADWNSPQIYSGEHSLSGLSYPVFNVHVIDTSIYPRLTFDHYFNDIELADLYQRSVPRSRYFTIELVKPHRHGAWLRFENTWNYYDEILFRSSTNEKPLYQRQMQWVHARMKELTYAYSCHCPYHQKHPITSIRKTTFNRAFKEAYHCIKYDDCPKGRRSWRTISASYDYLLYVVKEAIKSGQLEPLIEPITSLQRLCLDTIRANHNLCDLVKSFPTHCRLTKLVFMKIYD